MLVHLGPVESTQMDGWLRFARRLSCELRTEPGDMGSDFSHDTLTEWNLLIDQWTMTLEATGLHDTSQFVWRGELDPDKAEYLLHSWQRATRSATVAAWITPDDSAAHGLVTYHIMKRVIDALESEGVAHVEYVEQLRSEIARFRSAVAR